MFKKILMLYFCVFSCSLSCASSSKPIHIPDWFSSNLLKKLNIDPDLYMPFCKGRASIWGILERCLSWEPPYNAKLSHFATYTIEQWIKQLSPQQCSDTLLLLAQLLHKEEGAQNPPDIAISVFTTLLQRATYDKMALLNDPIFCLLSSKWMLGRKTTTTFLSTPTKIGTFINNNVPFTKNSTSSDHITVVITAGDYPYIKNSFYNSSITLNGNLNPSALAYCKTKKLPLLFRPLSKKTITHTALSQDGTTVALVFLKHYLRIWKLSWAKKESSIQEVFFYETKDPLSSIMLSPKGSFIFFETKDKTSISHENVQYFTSCIDLKTKPITGFRFLAKSNHPIKYKDISIDEDYFIFMRKKSIFIYLPQINKGPVEINFQEPIKQINLTNSHIPIVVSAPAKKQGFTTWWALARRVSFFTFYCLNALRNASHNKIISGELSESLVQKFQEHIALANKELEQAKSYFKINYVFLNKNNIKNATKEFKMWAYKEDQSQPIYPW